MALSRRRVVAVMRKELLDLRRNGNVVYAMVVLPLVFLIQPIIEIFTIPSGAAAGLRKEHALLYMLAIPALVPATIAAYSIVGERVQGTLEPILSTPVRRAELLLGKALAAFVPSVLIAYSVFALYVVLVEALGAPGVASAMVRGSDVVAQIVFTPLLTGWSIWVGMAISSRATDPRTAAQLATLATLPTIAVTTLLAFQVIPPRLSVAVAFGALLVVLNRVGWRLATRLFDRERLITGTR